MPNNSSPANSIVIIGGGLAGCEAAWQLARRGQAVILVEMRPEKMTPAHQTSHLAELVCSNSFRSDQPQNAVGLLKEEMAQLDSLIMRCARKSSVPAGSALAVDREIFAKQVESELAKLPLFTLVRDEVVDILNHDPPTVLLASGKTIKAKRVIMASGPLTSEPLYQFLGRHMAAPALYFYDSIAPIVESSSLDMAKLFRGARLGHGQSSAVGEGDYLNSPLTRELYEALVAAIKQADKLPLHEVDRPIFFEGCLPIEVMAERGMDTLRYGPMKNVGLIDPHTGKKPYAVVQLRQDDLHAALYNLVGFQTRMTWPEQKRIFRMLPGLECAEFVRLGAMHRNTFVCSPKVLRADFSLQTFPQVHLAGQITGCEGYVESAAIGLFVGLSLSCCTLSPPATTALGALIRHILKHPGENFQPMNVNFGLFDPLEQPGRDRKEKMVERSRLDFTLWAQHNVPLFSPLKAVI